MKRVSRIKWMPWVLLAAVWMIGPPRLQGQQAVVELTPVWVRLGDAEGAIDEERGIASVESAEFSPDGTLIASAAKRAGDVRVWTREGDQRWQQFHENDPDDEVEVVAWTRDGQYVLSGGEDHRVRVWRAADGTPIRTLDHIASIDGMRFSHSGVLLATGDEAGQVNIWDTSDPDPANWPATPLYILIQGPDQDRPGGGTGHSDVNSIDWTTDDGFIFTAGRNAEVRRWEVAGMGDADQGLRQSYLGFSDSIKSTRLSPDGTLVAAGGQRSPDGAVRVWDVASGALIKEIHFPQADKIEAVEFTPDGRFLFAGGNEGKDGVAGYPGNGGFGAIRAYDVANDFALALEQPVFRQEYFDFNEDGSLLVSSHEDGTVRLWQVEVIEVPSLPFADIRPASGRVYRIAMLQTGASLYTDRPDVVTALPEALRYAWFIQTANNDHAATGGDFLRFELREPAMLYAAYDPRATVLPAWLGDWEATGERIEIPDFGVDHLLLYRKAYPAGEVVLGGNLAPPAAGAVQNYVLAALPPGTDTSVGETSGPAGEGGLRGNYPNPFYRSTTIRFDLPEGGEVRVRVFDVLGREVLVVPWRMLRGGEDQTIEVEAGQLPGGVYLYRVETLRGGGLQAWAGQMIVLK